jgi:orotidine-5'-phosphate decarboxylase
MADSVDERARRALAFPLDYPDLDSAKKGAALVVEAVGVLKVGLELFVSEGPKAVALGKELGCEIFLDLKLHDIPETVERAVASACQLGVRYLTLHALGGNKMIEKAAARVQREGAPLTLLAVTVLTSADESDLRRIGVPRSPAEQVELLAKVALESGAGGLVCSPLEVESLRAQHGAAPVLVTPGIRPAAGSNDDQKRTGTPAQAIRSGSSILVVGRPIRDASDPRVAALSISREIAEAMRATA